ncbi:LysR family transcriptional regulator [Cryobacterium algoritolerans]|uniref:LysR family transcriptional regulator n=1 Tax=Cryobacterium algoritolerans TaxID=1259184 RepID=A0A4R8WR71_9MICO|nr:LysR family transcriptional regulator [Cryobacterium algoritolerans]TFC14705.1 LysR family transcriptional regulator [Cryobacterium algoritolerans]
MELRQLEYLVAVVEEASFTRAGERMLVSQSGISAQIRQLEREVGQQLLDRSGRAVQATQVGAAMLPFARAAIAAVVNARLAVDEVTNLIRGHARIGMVTACSIPVVFDLLAQFHDTYPGVSLTLTEDYSTALSEDVLKGHLDLALVGVAGKLPDGLASHVLVDDMLVAAVPQAHPLFSRSEIAFSQLEEYPIITMPRGTGIRSAFDDGCQRAGISPRITCAASTSDAIARLTVRGLGVAVLTESMVPEYEDLHAVTLTGSAPRSRLEFIWRAAGPRAPAAQKLIDMMNANLAN